MRIRKSLGLVGALAGAVFASDAAADDYGRFINVSVSNLDIHSTNTQISTTLPVLQVAAGVYLNEFVSIKLEYARGVAEGNGYSQSEFDALTGTEQTKRLNISLDSYTAIGIEDEVPLGKSAYFFVGASYAMLSFGVVDEIELNKVGVLSNGCGVVGPCADYSNDGTGMVLNTGLQFASSENAFLKFEFKKYPALDLPALSQSSFGRTTFEPRLLGVSYQKVF